MAGADDRGGDGFHVIAVHPLEGDALSGESCGSHEGAGFDPIRDHGVLDSFELLHSFDHDPPSAGSGDLGSHGIEEVSEIEDLGLRRCGFDDGDAFGQGRGHHHIVGAEDGRTVFSTEIDFRAAQAIGGGECDVSSFELHLRAEGLETF